MAKNSVVEREKKRERLCAKYRERRKKLRIARSNIHLSDKERADANLELQRLPRDSSLSRRRNRCKRKLCGRPRAYNRLTGLCRLHMRIAMLAGLIPGMRKASW